MKRLCVRLLALSAATFFLSLMSGCEQRPELDFNEYGAIADHLPVVRDLPVYFPIADELETKPCRIREDVQGACQEKLYASQGRERELEMKRIAEKQKEIQEDRERRARMKAIQDELDGQPQGSQESPMPEQDDAVSAETIQEEAAEPEEVAEPEQVSEEVVEPEEVQEEVTESDEILDETTEPEEVLEEVAEPEQVPEEPAEPNAELELKE